MYDKEILYDLLEKIASCIEKIQNRFEPVKTVADLTDSPASADRIRDTGPLIGNLGS